MAKILAILILACSPTPTPGFPVTDHGGCPAGWYFDTNQQVCVFSPYPASL